MKATLFSLIMLLSAAQLAAQNILPTPRSVEHLQGSFHLDSSCQITALNPEAERVGEYLGQYLPLARQSFLRLGAAVVLDIDPVLPREGYRLEVGEQRISIFGGSYNGLFYGVQSLLQLLPAEVYEGNLSLPCEVACCRIEDSPRFGYRASHLDVARTWMPLERVKQHIDRMAWHKLNTLHLHLTDDEGWRIEILSHPELTDVGGFRGGDSPIEPVYGRWFEKYGGYFTQQELRELVAYAAERSVEIIPEIDLPGHSRTFARLHPEILCDYTPNLERSAGYDVRNVFCASREENFSILEEVLREVCALFPSKYIHIGGDEVDMSQWKRCPRCQERMKREGWEPEQLQQYFMSRLVSILKSQGKEPVVWNEAINGGMLGKSALVQGWESVKACRKSTSEGYQTVVMPGQYFYFDMRQSQHEEGHVWAAIFDAEKVYNFDLSQLGFTPEQQRHVVGFEGTFFSEAYIGHNPESDSYLDYMLWPRTVALAELCWHYDEKDWAQFRSRLTQEHFARMDAMSIGYRLFPPRVNYQNGHLSATADQAGEQLHYTIDPDSTQHPYIGAIATSTPELYRFRSTRATEARSPWVAHPSYYKTIRPALHFTTSLPESEKAPFERIDSYKGAAWTTRTHHAGDWLRYDFTEPLVCREIYLQTGYLHLPRCTFRKAVVEVSRDGEHFEPAGELEAGAVTLRPQFPIRSIRVTATSTGNGEERVIIQSLKIRN